MVTGTLFVVNQINYSMKMNNPTDIIEDSITSYSYNRNIRNMQVVSSNHVLSIHSSEAYKCQIFKPFFLFIR